tara:strand:- start:519 stop:866 length:348 start_codon:yes stop_codon:yes gene_type:complete
MANPLKGEVLVPLDKEYKCRLTIDHCIKIENELGKGILELTTEISQAKITISTLVTVLKYALRGGGNDFQDRDIHKIIQNVGIVTASTEVAKLLAATLSDPDSEEDNEGKPQATG